MILQLVMFSFVLIVLTTETICFKKLKQNKGEQKEKKHEISLNMIRRAFYYLYQTYILVATYIEPTIIT